MIETFRYTPERRGRPKKPPTTRMVSYRVPIYLYAALEAEATRCGVTKTDVIVKALEKAFSGATEKAAIE